MIRVETMAGDALPGRASSALISMIGAGRHLGTRNGVRAVHVGEFWYPVYCTADEDDLRSLGREIETVCATSAPVGWSVAKA